MAEQGQIEIEVSVDGSAQAVRELGAVTEGVTRAGTSATSTTSAFEGFANTSREATSKIQAVAGSIQALVGALGGRDRTAGLVASVAGATAQFAAMGSMLGPSGTVVAGLVGLTTGLVSAATATDSVTTAVDRAADSLRNATTEADRYAAAMAMVRAENDAAARGARGLAISTGGALTGLTEDEGRAEILSRRAEIARLLEEYSSAAGSPRVRRLQEEIERLEREVLGESSGGIVVEEGETVFFRDPGPGPRRPDTRQRFQGGRAGLRTSTTQSERHDFFAEAELEIEEDTNERIIAMREERYAMLAEKAEEAAQTEIEIAKRQYEEMARIGAESDAARAEADAIALEQREESIGEWTGMLGNVTSQFGKTLGAIATGERTAEEAFKGLAAAFLEMISQYAAMKAATEFADAASSFARYDYGGGAAHIAAGVAFTAVAVATGIGAAAINQPPQQPAKPEAAQSTSGGGGGGDVNIFWNSPVVTSATEAELGRNLRQMLAAGGA